MKTVVQIILAMLIAYFGTQIASDIFFNVLDESNAIIISFVFAFIIGLSSPSISKRIIDSFQSMNRA